MFEELGRVGEHNWRAKQRPFFQQHHEQEKLGIWLKEMVGNITVGEMFHITYDHDDHMDRRLFVLPSVVCIVSSNLNLILFGYSYGLSRAKCKIGIS